MPYQLKKMSVQTHLTFFYRFIFLCLLMQILVWALKTHCPFLIEMMQSNLAWFSGSLYTLFDKPISIINNVLLSQTSKQYLYVEVPCLGLDMCAGLVALQLTAHSTWRKKFTAIFYGLILLQLFNCIRIAHIFSIIEAKNVMFDYYHLFIWQSMNVIFSLMLNVVLMVWFHPHSSISRTMQNTYLVKILASLTIFSPLLLMKQALASGGGGSSSGSAVPFIELEQWQFALLLIMVLTIIKYFLKTAAHAAN